MRPGTSSRKASIASLATISSTLDSLFKVLCIFPSRYLFAIGLSPVFSLGWGLPPVWGCDPEQPDSSRRRRAPALAPRAPGSRTGLSPSEAPLSRGLVPGGSARDAASRSYNSATPLGAADSKPELLPLRSPLLRESPLVSFPPLSNMLKFGGWSCPIRGRGVGFLLCGGGGARGGDLPSFFFPREEGPGGFLPLRLLSFFAVPLLRPRPVRGGRKGEGEGGGDGGGALGVLLRPPLSSSDAFRPPRGGEGEGGTKGKGGGRGADRGGGGSPSRCFPKPRGGSPTGGTPLGGGLEVLPPEGGRGLVEGRRSNGHARGIARERKVRSKLRWFAWFCNSHQLSHFAAFFIVARTKISVVVSLSLIHI